MSLFMDFNQTYVSPLNLFKFFGDVQYGKTNIETMDVFLPTSMVSTGVVFNFHGGGFRGGKKENTYKEISEINFIEELLSNGIAFVNVDYKFLNTNGEKEGVIKSLQSSERCLELIHFFSDAFNIDVNKVILRGSSSGAGIAMYLAYRSNPNDNLENPIYNSYINVKGISINIPTATYDILRWDEVFSKLEYSTQLDYNTNIESKKALDRFYGTTSYLELLTPNLVDYRSKIDFLSKIEQGLGKPTRVTSNNTFYDFVVSNTILDINHSPYHAEMLRDKLIQHNIEVLSDINGLSGDNTNGESEIDFIIRKLS